jgi:protein-glutamine gamma-glutamyltransferase
MSVDVRRVVAFTALAAFASHHWFLLVDGSDAWRWISCVGIGAAGAVTLIALRGRRPLAVAAGSAAVFAGMLVGGLLAVGIPLASLLPGGGDDLGTQLSRGLSGVSQIDTPYDGPSAWTELGIMAAVPLGVSVAMLAAFWPAGEGRTGRALGLGALVLLYATSVTWESPGSELARGIALFGFVSAVLWLPDLRPSRAVAAAGTALLAVAVAFPLAGRVDASDPVISYTDWEIFGAEKRITFNWNHTYGRIDWPQEGSEVFVASTDRPLYWKTYVLDQFDGRVWTRADDGFGEYAVDYYLSGATVNTMANHPEWMREFEIELTGLRSQLAVTAGAPQEIEGIEVDSRSGDGTTTAEDSEIPSGTTYDVSAYVPEPSNRQLRRAEGINPTGAERYTSLWIPQAPSTGAGSDPPVLEEAMVPPRGVVPLPNERQRFPGSDEAIDAIVEGTAYERVLRLSRALTDGARTDFAAVSRVQGFLASNYTYDQNVPLSRDPLPAFLFEDRAGYCQQFSGAMALMLRMVGIPSRVVSGFAPGLPQASGSYTVTDEEAHSWVEVLYPGIGWVTVDPTPGQTPAHTDVDIPGSAAGASSALNGVLGGPPDRPERGRGLGGNRAVPDNSGDAGGSPVPLLAFLAFAGGGTAVIVRRRRRLRSPEGAELQLRELEDALRATGRARAPGTTLSSIQEMLKSTVGPEAARYAAALRESRYGRRHRKRPGSAERRSFRWALARHSGPFGWWKAVRAVPLGGPKA